jgi:urease accessory protein
MKSYLLNPNQALITVMVTDLALLRLLQLVSPGLPIGMYSYSQGLERAVDDGWVSNASEAGEWISGLMATGMVSTDLPVLARLYNAWEHADEAALVYWSKTLLAYRETVELRTEDVQTGQALARLISSLGMESMQMWTRKPEATLATLFSFAAVNWGIAKREALIGYLWGWLENQVLCAVKLVPLGQVAGQKLLLELASQIPILVDEALSLADVEIGGSAFGLALASSRHEMQYSRLFRS